MNLARAPIRLAAGLLACLLAACGGGGGAGDPGATAPPGAASEGRSVETAVAVSLRAPGALIATAFAGGSVPPGSVLVDVTGDPGVLAGRTVIAVLEEPNPLFDVRGVFLESSAPPAVRVQFGSDISRRVPEGHHQGVMKLHACLDLGCRTELAGSPLTIPYDIDIKAGLKVSQEALSLTTVFGVALPPSEITVSLPFGGTDWRVSTVFGRVLTVKKSGDKLLITPNPFLPPGSYTADMLVESSAPDLEVPGREQPFTRQVTMRYTITPASAPFAIAPTSASHTFTAGDPTQQQGMFVLAVQDSRSRLDARGVRLDAGPAAAAGHPALSTWLLNDGNTLNTYSVVPCGTNPLERDCLPAGTYTGAILLRHTSVDAAATDFEFPVTMIIAPGKP